MDYGSGNNRRFINIKQLADTLEEKQQGITEALIGFHSLTGCDFTSCFFHKGKVKPFQKLEADPNHVAALRSLTSGAVDIPGITCFICSCYGINNCDINEARYKAFNRVSSGKEHEPRANIKTNCASLPPCYHSQESGPQNYGIKVQCLTHLQAHKGRAGMTRRQMMKDLTVVSGMMTVMLMKMKMNCNRI